MGQGHPVRDEGPPPPRLRGDRGQQGVLRGVGSVRRLRPAARLRPPEPQDQGHAGPLRSTAVRHDEHLALRARVAAPPHERSRIQEAQDRPGPRLTGTLRPVSEQTLQTVPFNDLAGLHAPIKEDALAAFDELIDRSEFGVGASVAEFEAAFARFCGAEECVGLSNGLDALRLLLQVVGVQPGDEVIVPAMTFIATFAAVTQVGAVPVPVDVTWADYGLDAA